jgi:oligoendopeptidase F
MRQLSLILNKYSNYSSYVAPELISIGEEKVLAFCEKDELLKPYKFSYEKLFRRQQHILSSDEEKLISNYGPVTSVASQLYNALSLTDRVDEEVTLTDGTKVTVNTSNWRSLIANAKDAKDRATIFEAAFKRYKDNKDAFASTYNLVLQSLAASYKNRGYNSALEAKLFNDNIPLEVFTTLKDTVYESTEPIKRYLKIRKKHLGLETYRTYDRFLDLISTDKKYTYEEGKAMFFESIKDFDEEFRDAQHEALRDGYVDVEPKDGKRTGAFSSSLYGFHPYILLNHEKTLSDVFTIVHEAGHSAHSILSNANQPLATHSYTIFVAEIASTFNERVLADYLLKTAKTKEEKIAVIESEINGIMSTFYRQTLFATYEYEANKLVEQGIPLNATNLSGIMIDLYKHYYDIDIKEENGKEYVWAYIPHLFRTPFYVYQYASSYSASLKIYQDIKDGKKDAMEKYLNMLKSGGSDYPVNQAKAAGADLTDKTTFTSVVRRFNELIDQLEKLL